MTTRSFPANFKSLSTISDFIVTSSEKAGFTPDDVLCHSDRRGRSLLQYH